MKEFSEIQALLDRYWEGETTLEEERILKDYFNSGQTDSRLSAFLPLFRVLIDERKVEMKKARIVEMQPRRYAWHAWVAAASLALLLAAGFWWQNNQHDTAPQQIVRQTPPNQEDRTLASVQTPEKETVPETKMQVRKPGPRQKKRAVDPETEKAMEEIKAALALVSSKIGKGKQEAAKGTMYLENVDKLFKKKQGTEG